MRTLMEIEIEKKALETQKEILEKQVNELKREKFYLVLGKNKNPLDDIILYITSKYGILEEELYTKKRLPELMKPKKEFVYLLKDKLNYTFQRICNLLQYEHHSSIMYLYKIYKKENNL